jgi:hypothetical protein
MVVSALDVGNQRPQSGGHFIIPNGGPRQDLSDGPLRPDFPSDLTVPSLPIASTGKSDPVLPIANVCFAVSRPGIAAISSMPLGAMVRAHGCRIQRE